MIKATYEATGKRLVIVGSNSGIGKALTQQLVDSKAIVFGMDIQDDSTFVDSNNYHYFKANPLDQAEIKVVCESIKKQVQQLDGLVNLSGAITHFKPIAEMTITEWNETYDISFKSCFNACKTFIPLLQNASKAAIVNMSSGLAFIGQKNYGPYSAAKAAVISFSKTLAAEVAPNIRVNTVAPGAVETPFIYKEDGSTRFNKAAYEKMIPLGSVAKPEEIASVILFLLSEGAAHITGQCIHVNGGVGMR